MSERKKSARRDNFIRELTRALIMLCLAVAVFLVSRNDKIMDRIKKAAGFEESGQSSAQIENAGLTVEFIDVGQGDSTLISSGGKHMLIDTGDRDSSDRVIKHLKELKIERLDYLVLSHPHADHIGEAGQIVEQFDIGDIIVPEVSQEVVPDTECYDELVEAADEKDEQFKNAPDKSFELGECTVRIYAPEKPESGADNPNNYSLIVRADHGENSFLFVGDCELEEESQMLARGIDLDTDVLKAGHHGSDTSSSKEWLEAVSPEYAVISCGAENRYGHPDAETVERLENCCEQIYITAESGSITFSSDGENLSVETESGRSYKAS